MKRRELITLLGGAAPVEYSHAVNAALTFAALLAVTSSTLVRKR